jgi:ribulose-phosphate 3-epimerase
MDGKFVPSRSITCRDLMALNIKVGWEAHLMVENPEEQFECFKNAGAEKVVFHYEATDAPDAAIACAWELGLKVGIAVNSETPVEDVVQLADAVDSVLFLSVKPGFYGSPFIPEVLDKIREFRATCPNAEIGIDGGIKESNIEQVVASGVDVVNVGSAITLTPQPVESFRRLQALANGAA